MKYLHFTEVVHPYRSLLSLRRVAVVVTLLAVLASASSRADIVIDDGSAVLTGSWSYRSEAQHPGTYNDSGSRFGEGGDDTATYTVDLPSSGLWSLEAYNITASLSAVLGDPSMQFSIKSGTQVINYNQRIGGSTDQFISLGIYEMNAGTNTYVVTTGTLNTHIDAVRWAEIGVDIPAAVVIDSGDRGVKGYFTKSGTWQETGTGSGTKLFGNSDWVSNTEGSVATFSAPVALARYDVQITWSSSSSWATSALVEVESADGEVTSTRQNMTVENATNATANGVTWQSLGVFPFDTDSEVRIIRDASAGGYIVADGIRLVFDSMTTGASGTVIMIM